MKERVLATKVPVEFADAVKAKAKELGTTQGKFMVAALKAAVAGTVDVSEGAEEPAADAEPAPAPSTPRSTRLIRRPNGHCQVYLPGTAKVEITGPEDECRRLAEERWPGIRLEVEETARKARKTATRKTTAKAKAKKAAA